MPKRHSAVDSYRYGYQGNEKDDEIKGDGNSYTTHYRLYDPRAVRWFSPDPQGDNMPWQSPYISMDGNPILLNDQDGDCTDCPNNPKKNQVHVSKNSGSNGGMPFKAPNGQMVSGTDGSLLGSLVSGKDLNYVAWIYTGDEAGWQAFAIETSDGNKFVWDSEKAWYVSSSGEEFDDSWTFDVTNAIGANVSPVVQMAVDKYTKGDAFKSVKDAIERHDGGLGSFIWTGMKKSISNMFSDGHEGSQARLSLFTGILSSGGPFGGMAASESYAVFNSLNRSIAIRYLSKTGQLANFADVDGFSFSFFRTSYIWHNSSAAAKRGGWWSTTQFGSRANAWSSLGLGYSGTRNFAQYGFKTRVFGVSIRGTAAPQGLSLGGGLQHMGIKGYFFKTRLQLLFDY